MAGDGLIVATALGSSAYSMAAGGPVLAVGTSAFVCTPLAMHGGSAAPIVVPQSSALEVRLHPGFGGFELEIDGQKHPASEVHYRVSLHEAKVTLVAFDALPLGLTQLRSRGLITDSPRVLARDARGDGRRAEGRDGVLRDVELDETGEELVRHRLKWAADTDVG
jgi:NAD+ kinase